MRKGIKINDSIQFYIYTGGYRMPLRPGGAENPSPEAERKS